MQELKAVGESVKIPLEYYSNNIGSMINVCRLMTEFGVDKLVFSSSATVYGESEDVPFTEESPLGRCTNPYGWTKWMLEQVLRDYAKSEPSKRICLLRYFNPVGAHESGLIGEDPRGIPNNLFPYISKVAGGTLECLTVFGTDYDTPDGTCLRDYIHVVDLADGHVKAIKQKFLPVLLQSVLVLAKKMMPKPLHHLKLLICHLSLLLLIWAEIHLMTECQTFLPLQTNL